jgi:hypothetical protein
MAQISEWFPTYMRCLYTLVACWEPGKDFEKEFSMQAMGCFITRVLSLFPSISARQHAELFLQMDASVVSLLETESPRFFRVFPKYLEIMQNDPRSLLKICLQSSTSLFNWIYLLQSYFVILFNRHGHAMQIPNLRELHELYDPQRITKTDWGRPTWYVIHTTSLFCPGGHDHFRLYHELLNCLQYVLPCPKCREHLKSNLNFIDFSRCGGFYQGHLNVELFKCSWNLHNIVNKSVNKPQVSFRDALRLYSN